MSSRVPAAARGRRDEHGGGVSGRRSMRRRLPASGCRSRRRRVHSPCLPPDFSSSRISPSTARGSTALIMSCRVSPAIATAVSASISTPVLAVTETVASMRIASPSKPNSIVTESSGRMWASGISSLVRFAPAMPAMRAVASTSALGRPSARTSAIDLGRRVSRPAARATRRVTGLAPTSIMRARPSSSRWLSELIGPRYRPLRPPGAT